MKRFFNIFILLILLSSAIPLQASAESKYISLKGSCIYHKIDGGCGKIKETNPDNLLYFDTIEEAKMAGCTQCSNCFGIESINSENFEFIIPHQPTDESSLEQVVPHEISNSLKKPLHEGNFETLGKTNNQVSENSSSKYSTIQVIGLLFFLFILNTVLISFCALRVAEPNNKITKEASTTATANESTIIARPKQDSQQAADSEEIAQVKEITAQIIKLRQERELIKKSVPPPKVTEKRFVTSRQTQAELDAWKRKWKKDDEVGREYERYIGYLCESRGYRVTYYGATKGKSDKGRDLLVKESKNAKEIYVVQCKYRGKDKEIYENTVNQTFGTTEWLARKNPENKYTPVLVTNVPISEDARDCADTVGVKVFEGVPMQERPLIKCNISKSRDKIYHLPFEQGYDAVQIGGKKGCFYAWTAQEAEEKGFRRSHHNIDQRNS